VTPLDPATGVASVVLESINTRLNELRDDVKDVKKHVDDKLSELAETYVSKEVFKLYQETIKIQFETSQQALDKRIKDLEDDRKKYIGVIITAVILAVLALIIKSGNVSFQ